MFGRMDHNEANLSRERNMKTELARYSVVFILICFFVPCIFVCASTDLVDIDPEMLYNYQFALVKEADRAWRAEISKLKTVEDWEKRKQYVREKTMEMIGEFPERTPLNARTTAAVDCGDYRIEMIVYESRPGFYVTANLYLPKECEFPVPGILFPCGHSSNGKAAEPYQRCCIGLAKKGFVVLNYDPISQGERLQHWEIDLQRTPTGYGTREHCKLGNGCILLGYNLANFRIWDGIRGIDYLLTRPEVDPERIGCTGNSGGGTLSTYISALDERVTVGVPSCYITTLVDRIRVRITADDEQNFNPCFVHGIDHFDLLSLRVPKPTQIDAAIQDYFPIEGARQTFRDLQALYRIYDAEERVNLVEADEKHGYSLPLREGTYAWMNRWLKDGETDDAEPPTTIQPDTVLQCTLTGQVVESLGGETVFTINRDRYRRVGYTRHVPETREDLDTWCEVLREDIRDLLVLPPSGGIPNIHIGDTQKNGEITSTRVVFESEPGIAVPGVLLMPQERPSSLTIAVFGDGKDAHLDDERILKRLDKGNGVYLIDPRGVGETISPHGDPDRYYDVYRQETGLTYTSFMLGKPLLGQRVYDVLRSLDGISAVCGANCPEIHLLGQGRAALMVLFAGALDERVESVTCDRMLVSYESLVVNKYFSHHPTSLIPNVLLSFDLPLVAGLIAPRPLVLDETVDPMKTVLPVASVRETYRPAESIYRMQGNVRGLSIRSSKSIRH